MTFKKYQLFLIGLSTTLLMTACTQAEVKTTDVTKTSSISTITNTTNTTNTTIRLNLIV